MLRKWQAECVTHAMEKYKSGFNHFFCQATPGAGKSIMAATLANTLLNKGMIDLILCFSPSVSVADSMRNYVFDNHQLSIQRKSRLNWSVTYLSVHSVLRRRLLANH